MIKGQILFTSLILLSLFFSCEVENKKYEKIEYYADGKIKSKQEYVDSLQNGTYFEYYKDGSVKCIINWKNDTLNGEARYFDSLNHLIAIISYKNGMKNGTSIDFFSSTSFIRTKANYRKNKLHGTVFQYFENYNGKLMAEINYINFQSQEKDMGGVWYDTLGNVAFEQRRVILNYLKDTFSLNEEVILNIELAIPSFDSTTIIIGDYDGEFYTKNTTEFDTLHTINHKSKVVKRAEKRGENFIRGYVKNWKVEKKSKEITRISERLPIYFEYKYYVK